MSCRFEDRLGPKLLAHTASTASFFTKLANPMLPLSHVQSRAIATSNIACCLCHCLRHDCVVSLATLHLAPPSSAENELCFRFRLCSCRPSSAGSSQVSAASMAAFAACSASFASASANSFFPPDTYCRSRSHYHATAATKQHRRVSGHVRKEKQRTKPQVVTR